MCRLLRRHDGPPQLAPGVYFRLLLIGYFEGIDAERGIAWRAADSFALRDFLGLRTRALNVNGLRVRRPPKGRLAQVLKRRRFLGPKAYVLGGGGCEYQGTIRTAWESLVLLAHGIEPTRTRAHGRVSRDKLAEIDLHWHDLRHEAACRWLAKGLDRRAIQLLLGHADLKTTQRYLNVTDEELRKTMAAKLWNRGSAR
jgi:integrase